MQKNRMNTKILPAAFMAVSLLAGCMLPGSSTSSTDESAALRSKGSAAQDDSGSKHGGGVAKVTICHIPPGNPANMHTIRVGSPAVPAHLAHGDRLGACGDGGTVHGHPGGNGHGHPGNDSTGHGDDTTVVNPPPDTGFAG